MKDGDTIKAGHTVFRVVAPPPEPDDLATLNLPPSDITRLRVVTPDDSPAVPGFRIQSKLGRGGMGVVYRALREADGTPGD